MIVNDVVTVSYSCNMMMILVTYPQSQFGCYTSVWNSRPCWQQCVSWCMQVRSATGKPLMLQCNRQVHQRAAH
jgi:hypothetical protein